MDYWCENHATRKQNPRNILENKNENGIIKKLDKFENEEFYYFMLNFVHTFSK